MRLPIAMIRSGHAQRKVLNTRQRCCIREAVFENRRWPDPVHYSLPKREASGKPGSAAKAAPAGRLIRLLLLSARNRRAESRRSDRQRNIHYNAHRFHQKLLGNDDRIAGLHKNILIGRFSGKYVLIIERMFYLFSVFHSQDVNFLEIRIYRKSACTRQSLQHCHIGQERISARASHLAEDENSLAVDGR